MRHVPALFAITLAAAFTLAATPAFAGEPSQPASTARLYTLVNKTFDSVTAVSVAPAGAGAYDDVALGEALRGGLTAATVRLPAGDCLRDVRVTFRDQRQQVFPGIDVCRSSGLRLTATGGAHGAATVRAEQLSLADRSRP